MRHSRLAFSLQAAGEDLGQIKHIQLLQRRKLIQVRAIQALLGVLRLKYQELPKVDAKDYHQQKAEP